MFKLGDSSLAEDLIQETFLAALRGRTSFSGHSAERTWFVAILKNKIYDHLRKKNREQQVENIETTADLMDDQGVEHMFDANGRWKIDVSQWSDPDKSLEQNAFWTAFANCVSALPPRLADLFVLKELNGMGNGEVCKLLQITTTNNMWVMLSRARLRLRQCLEANWFHAGND